MSPPRPSILWQLKQRMSSMSWRLCRRPVVEGARPGMRRETGSVCASWVCASNAVASASTCWGARVYCGIFNAFPNDLGWRILRRCSLPVYGARRARTGFSPEAAAYQRQLRGEVIRLFHAVDGVTIGAAALDHQCLPCSTARVSPQQAECFPESRSRFAGRNRSEAQPPWHPNVVRHPRVRVVRLRVAQPVGKPLGFHLRTGARQLRAKIASTSIPAVFCIAWHEEQKLSP